MTAPNTPTPELVERTAIAIHDHWKSNLTSWEETCEKQEGAAKFFRDIAAIACASQADAIAKLTAERDAMLQELKAATGHDDGLIAIRHLILRATQAEDYVTAKEGKWHT